MLFLCEVLQERCEQLFRVADLFGVFADDPNERCLGFWFIQILKVSAESRDDALVVGRVFSEDVLKKAEGQPLVPP